MTDITETSMRYREFSPSAEVQPFVINFWEFTVESVSPDGYEHHVPPDGCVSLLLRYASDGAPPVLLFLGPRTETHRVSIQGPERYLGIRLWPHSIRAVLNVDPVSLSGAIGPAALIVPDFAVRLAVPSEFQIQECVGQFESAILSGVDATQLDAIVAKAVELTVTAQGNLTVSGLAEEIGISSRSLQRRFRDQTGLTPKQFARLRRFRAAVWGMVRDQQASCAEIAYDVGFSDQSHLSREFTQLIGLTGEQLREKHSVIEHDGIDPDAGED